MRVTKHLNPEGSFIKMNQVHTSDPTAQEWLDVAFEDRIEAKKKFTKLRRLGTSSKKHQKNQKTSKDIRFMAFFEISSAQLQSERDSPALLRAP